MLVTPAAVFLLTAIIGVTTATPKQQTVDCSGTTGDTGVIIKCSSLGANPVIWGKTELVQGLSGASATSGTTSCTKPDTSGLDAGKWHYRSNAKASSAITPSEGIHYDGWIVMLDNHGIIYKICDVTTDSTDFTSCECSEVQGPT